jgi:hypothetical protein
MEQLYQLCLYNGNIITSHSQLGRKAFHLFLLQFHMLHLSYLTWQGGGVDETLVTFRFTRKIVTFETMVRLTFCDSCKKEVLLVFWLSSEGIGIPHCRGKTHCGWGKGRVETRIEMIDVRFYSSYFTVLSCAAC